MKDTFYISTAIAYANGAPHLGHALEFIEADAIARYQKLRGKEVFFLTGTDEHGQKIMDSAREKQLEITEFVAKNVESFKQFMTNFLIDYSRFIQTSVDEDHKKSVSKLWLKMKEKGDIYKGHYTGWYCVRCEEYKQEKDLVNDQCSLHPQAKIQKLEQENYFFRLSRYSDEIARAIETKEVVLYPEFRANEILQLCKEGLEDVSFSRPKSQLEWGIPVPDDESQVMYVWCDALSNYISGVGYADNPEMFNTYWPCDLHIIGKDIMRFHAGIWLGMLLSAELPLPKAELIHGWIHVQGKRMSKSNGVFVDPQELYEHYGAEPVRYFLLSEIPVGNDGNFSYEQFENKTNADLANNLGNYINRVITLVERYIPAEEDLNFFSVKTFQENLWSEYSHAFDSYDHATAAQVLIKMVNTGNELLAQKEPWKIAKDERMFPVVKEILEQELSRVLHISIALWPFCPQAAEKVMKSVLGEDNCLPAMIYHQLENSSLSRKVSQIHSPGILFARVEADKSLKYLDTPQLQLPTLPLPESPEFSLLNLPVRAFVLEDLQKLGTGVKKRLKKEWQEWLHELARDTKQLEAAEREIKAAYELNASFGVGREFTPGNAVLKDYLTKGVDSFPFINPIVALYNYIETKYGFSIGVHDIDLLKGDVSLKICDGTESYWPLGQNESQAVPPGTYAYCDDGGKRVICWLEVKQSKETAVSDSTRHALCILQAYPSSSVEMLEKAQKEMKELMIKWLKTS